jgi:XTP/dITP diphosphohydrolase
MNLLIATGNKAKCQELRELLSDLPITLLDLKAFPEIEKVSETGGTFVDNASLKAVGYAVQTKLMTLADDSGLEVEALGGAPGVRSARYLGAEASDLHRIEALLKELGDDSNRAARFVSAVVIAGQNGEILNRSLGTCAGSIASVPRGSAGFGYDPIFIPDGYDVTFAELEAEVKNQISHRARALKSARLYLQNLTASSGAR